MTEELGNSKGMRPPRPPAVNGEKALLLFLTGAPGAGKTTFYESKLRESFPVLMKSTPSPLEQAEMERQRKELLNAHKSFVFQSSIVDMRLLKEARSHGFEVKAIFIGTEHPDLNIARILSRASRGGLFGPIALLREDYDRGLHELPAVKESVDELIVLDNTDEGRSPRVVAHFVNGEIAKVARSIPAWAQRSLAKEFTELMIQQRRRQERER